MTHRAEVASGGEYPAADRNTQLRQLHNIMVVQSIKGWTRSDCEQALLDARNGVVYRRTVNQEHSPGRVQ